MHKRHAQSQTEIDFLPPFGEPEVVTTGNAAGDIAIAGTVAAVGLAALANN
jgi:hypothetical protein